MRLLLASMTVVAAAAAFSPAQAKPGDRGWSQCAWTQAPASADAWLAMPVPTVQSSYTDANVLLGHRLIAMCDVTALDPLKLGRMPNWKALASALRSSRPAQFAPATPSAEVLLCRSSATRDGATKTFLYEIVRREAGRDTVNFQQYYDGYQGRPIKLPQGLRIQVQDPALVTRDCAPIGERGELATAAATQERG